MPALAQLDSAALRAKYGEPLHRETFGLPQGFDLAVDYNVYNEVCRLEAPGEMPPPPNFSGGFNGRQEMQNFLAGLVPGERFMSVSSIYGHPWKTTVELRAAGCEPTPLVPMAARLNAATLHAKFGEPLNRETFRVRPEVEIAVDYGANRQVCRIEIPALAENDREEVLSELVPDSMRGKELRRMMMSFGVPSESRAEYERVTISETGYGDTPNATTVRFKTQSCKP